uniref:Retrotransposon Copia-like N-terminal domain-containing protein n=1 Tax=Nicotiana tabacum TaxID=4097 RepID=A0A1S4CQ29_TOBAC|nr:PREDICTED: uncharacterized protein LOC107821169 [Nicotiana tabacum]
MVDGKNGSLEWQLKLESTVITTSAVGRPQVRPPQMRKRVAESEDGEVGRNRRSVFTMSNLSKLELVALDISGRNYLSWVLDAEIHLAAKGLGDTITQGNEASSQDKAKDMIFLCHHLDKGLKVEYLTMKDPFELWAGLKERYDHLKAMQQYRERGSKKYSELISYLLVVEQHNIVLMKNYEARPTGSVPIPEATVVVRRD